MIEFSSEGALRKWLKSVSPNYVHYASPLWRSKVTNTDELANAPPEMLDKIIGNLFHTSNIIAKAKGCGGCRAVQAV